MDDRNFDEVRIDIREEEVEGRMLYGWHLRIGEVFEGYDEFLYGSPLDALKVAQKRLYAWVKLQEKK